VSEYIDAKRPIRRQHGRPRLRMVRRSGTIGIRQTLHDCASRRLPHPTRNHDIGDNQTKVGQYPLTRHRTSLPAFRSIFAKTAGVSSAGWCFIGSIHGDEHRACTKPGSLDCSLAALQRNGSR